MSLLRITEFGGIIPVKGDRALPEGFATASLNTWLYGSELRGIRPRTHLTDVNNITKKVFRIPKPDSGLAPSDLTNASTTSIWRQFLDPDTDIVRGPLVNDQYKRWYFCSPSTGLMFNTMARMLAGLPDMRVGVPNPTSNPPITSVGGGAPPLVTVSYLVTWENEYGEESGPSAPSVCTVNETGSVTLSIPAPPTIGPTFAPITKINIYRTITSASGVATYFWITELLGPPFATSYVDDRTAMTDALLATHSQLNTQNFFPPPYDQSGVNIADNLQGIILMPNGFLIGWRGSDIYVSAPYQLHAWPVEYIVSTEYPIVGLGILGTTCVICTQGFPATISGVKPALLSLTKATTNEPCLSRGSIVSTPKGVYYASQNGLISISPGGIDNITAPLISHEDWIKFRSEFAPSVSNPDTPTYLRACRYQNGYLALRAIPELSGRSAFFLDPTSLKVALTEYNDFEGVHNIHNDVWSGEVFIIESAGGVNHVEHWDPPTSQFFMPVVWRSKEYQLEKEKNLAAYAIYWDDARFAVNPDDDDETIIAARDAVRLRVWNNRILVYDQIVPVNGRGVRLPSGFMGDIWQFEIRCRAPVYSLHVASTMKELRGA